MSKPDIVVSPHGVMYAGKDAVSLYRANAARATLKLHAVGLRGRVPLSQVLAVATEYTGKNYTSRQVDAAIADMDVWISTMLSALQVEVNKG